MLGQLRDPKWGSAIHESYMASSQSSTSKLNISTEPTTVSHKVVQDIKSTSTDGGQKRPPETKSALPAVQPLKAALYFDNVTGFGNWRVFLSTKMEKHLREQRKNMKVFKVIVKKIKYVPKAVY